MGKTTKKKTPKRAVKKDVKEVFIDSDTPMMDGYDDCICRVVDRFGQPSIVCYDIKKVLDKLQKQGMSYEEALEFFGFNQIGAWVGDKTPCFLSACKREDFVIADEEG